MSRLNLSLNIAAPPARVWSALCEPAQVSQWDSSVSGALDAPADYPRPGQHVRWRLKDGFWRLLHDRPQEVVREQKLRSLLSTGLVRYDETYTLVESDSDCGSSTDLKLELQVSVAIPLLGGLVDRMMAAADARRGFETSLASLKLHCENAG